MSQITAIVPFPPLIFSIKVVEDKNQDTPFFVIKSKNKCQKESGGNHGGYIKMET